MAEFEDFWKQYPRKVAKMHARRMWERLTAEQQFAALHALSIHVRYWRSAGRSIDHIPHAGTWLHGERWEDELEMPKTQEQDQWWKTRSGIEAKARQMGIMPRPGEEHHSLKARILAAERAA